MTKVNYISFFRSYWDAIKALKDDDRLSFYDAIFNYSFDAVEPELGGALAGMWTLMKPNVDKSITRAAAGKITKSNRNQTESNRNQNEIKTESNRNQNSKNGYMEKEEEKEEEEEKEKEKEEDTDKEKYNSAHDDFLRFWQEYPRKVGKRDAKKAFDKAVKLVDAQTIIDAVASQKNSSQWKKDGGTFIPYPATWLNRGSWDDEPPRFEAEELPGVTYV